MEGVVADVGVEVGGVVAEDVDEGDGVARVVGFRPPFLTRAEKLRVVHSGKTCTVPDQ